MCLRSSYSLPHQSVTWGGSTLRGSAMRRGIHHSYTGNLKEIGVFHQLRTQNSEKRELASADSNSAGALILDF